MRYKISKDNLHLVDSYLIPKAKFKRELVKINNIHPDSRIWMRSRKSLVCEWAVHNACYALGIARSRSKDCDLNYPQKWYVKLAYTLAGHIVWPFIK